MRIPRQRIRHPAGFIELDGSFGEGGGQLLRTACALSVLTGTGCRIRRVRGGRSQPGLRAQHCATVKGLAMLCGGRTSTLEVGTEDLAFQPGTLTTGTLRLRTGTAGSAALVLQGILLASLVQPDPLTVTIEGGTDVQHAPSCDYVKHVKVPLLRKLGIQVDLRVIKRGYYPKGGGLLEARIQPPAAALLPALRVPVASRAVAAAGISHACRSLSGKEVGERQQRHAVKLLTEALHVPVRIKVEYARARSPGSGLVLWAETAETVLGASWLGARDRPSVQVAREAADRLLRTYHTGASLDPWMGDQILPYLAVSDGPCVVSVPRLTRHMRTNMWVIRQFLNVEFFCEQVDQRVQVLCRPG